MTTTITLNRADVEVILSTLKELQVDHFKLIKNDASGIGYTLDIEYSHKINNRPVDVRVEVVGTENW